MNLNTSFPPLSRRHFLRRLGLTTGAAATLAPLMSLNAMGNPHPGKKKVIIIGAGLAGLCAAYELEQRGHEVVILEASSSHHGGRVRTVQFGDGMTGELGAMRIPTVHHLTRHYVKQFGLTLRPFVQSNGEAYYYVRGQKVRIKSEPDVNQFYSLAPNEVNKSPFDCWDQSVLALLNSLTPEEKADLRRPVFQTVRMRALDQLTLEAVLKQSGLSPEAIEFLASTWAYETSLQTTITELLREENEEVWIQSFDEIVGGMEMLPKAFVASLKAKPRMGAQVVRVEQANGKAAAVYMDSSNNRKLERVEGDALLCTVPLGVMTRIDFAPGLSGGKMRAARQVTYDSSAKVLLQTNRRFWESDEGIFGGGTYTDLPTGITYYPADNAEARNPLVSAGRGVFLASYSWGNPARRMGALSHAERVDLTTNNLGKIHPQLLEKGMIEKAVSWSWDNNPLSAGGAFTWFSPGQHETLYRHLIEPEGRLFFAGEHASLTHSWMQGAFESALRAVEQIVAAPI